MNDVMTTKTNKSTVTSSKPVPTDSDGFNIGRFIGNIFNYGYAGLKVVDILARIATASAVYIKVDQTMLHYGAAFLGVTALWEIGVSLIKAYGPNRK